MKTKFTQAFLFLSGFLLLVIGLGILLVPADFHAANGIAFGDDASLLSEIRAPGGLLTACSLVILVGVFRPLRRSISLQVTVFVYGTFGISRLLGMALDGMPSGGIVAATMIELAVAAIGLFTLVLGCKARGRRESTLGLSPNPSSP